MTECPYDIRNFSEELGLTIEETADMYKELVDEISVQVSELKDLLLTRDQEAVRRNLHNIKGLSSGYRLTDLYEAVIPLSQAVKNGMWESAEQYLKTLSSVWSCAVEALNLYFRGVWATPGQP